MGRVERLGRVRDAGQLPVLSLLRKRHVGVVLRVLLGVDGRVCAVRQHELPGLLARAGDRARVWCEYDTTTVVVGLGAC